MGQAEWVTVPISTRDVEGPMFFTAARVEHDRGGDRSHHPDRSPPGRA